MIKKFLIFSIILIISLACEDKKTIKKSDKKEILSPEIILAQKKSRNGYILWRNRKDYNTLKKALSFWEDSVKILKDEKIYEKLSEGYFLLSLSPSKDDDILKFYEKGIEYSLKAIYKNNNLFKSSYKRGEQLYTIVDKISKKNFKGVYWLTLNMLYKNIYIKKNHILLYKDDLDTLFKYLLKHYPNMEGIKEHYALFLFMIPKFADGDRDKAYKMLKEAKKRSPNQLFPHFIETKYFNNGKNYKKLLKMGWKDGVLNDILLKKIKYQIEKTDLTN